MRFLCHGFLEAMAREQRNFLVIMCLWPACIPDTLLTKRIGVASDRTLIDHDAKVRERQSNGE